MLTDRSRAAVRVMRRTAERHEGHLSNPYTALFYSSLEMAGACVEDPSLRRMLLDPPDIYHVNWPESCLNSASAVWSSARLLNFLLYVLVARLRGVRGVWTVHNLASHNRQQPRLEGILWTLFPRLCAATIHLSTTARSAALDRWPVLSAKPSTICLHGHYRGSYPDPPHRMTARHSLGIPTDAIVVAHVGALRENKQIDDLVAAFRQSSDPHWRLLLAGAASDKMQERLAEAAEKDARILLRFGRLIPAEVTSCLSACDLSVLPAAQMLNSGSALLSLSYDRPVLVPKVGSMLELENLVPGDWVWSFEPPLSEGALRKAVASSVAAAPSKRPSLDRFSWDSIGEAALMFLQHEVLGRSGDEYFDIPDPS